MYNHIYSIVEDFVKAVEQEKKYSIFQICMPAMGSPFQTEGFPAAYPCKSPIKTLQYHRNSRRRFSATSGASPATIYRGEDNGIDLG